MNYLPFKVKGGPELHAALKNLPAPYRNGWVRDSPYCYYKFDIIDLRLEQGDCNEIEISPEEFVSKVNSFIRASEFACKGSLELAQLLDTYHKAGLKDFQNDPCISPNKCYFIWENQLFSKTYSERVSTVSIKLFRTYWNSKFDISRKSLTTVDKTKFFVRGGKETKEVLCTLLNLGLFETILNVNDFSEEDSYFALGSMREGKITWTPDRKFYLGQGLTEITPSEVRALWIPTATINNIYCGEIKVSSINMESPKNSKPFGLSQKQTLKIVL